jgi:hypothetical protein
MPTIIHQNMRRLGGGDAARIAAYTAALAGVAGGVAGAAAPIVAVGFTELTNDVGAPPALGPIWAAMGVGAGYAIACRETASGVAEYTGIAAPGAVSFGRIILKVDRNGPPTIVCDPAPAGAAPAGGAFRGWCTTLPANSVPDYQHLVYVVVQLAPGVLIGIGFYHNIFAVNGGRSIAMQQLPDIAEAMLRDPRLAPMGAAARVYLCGDFNADPLSRHNRRGTTVTVYARGSMLPGALPAGNPQAVLSPAQVAAGCRPNGTLRSGNLYDYSFAATFPPVAAPPVPAPTPRIDVRTLDSPGPGMPGLMSDHAAVLLQI